jgi:hypothetical protein
MCLNKFTMSEKLKSKDRYINRLVGYMLELFFGGLIGLAISAFLWLVNVNLLSLLFASFSSLSVFISVVLFLGLSVYTAGFNAQVRMEKMDYRRKIDKKRR